MLGYAMDHKASVTNQDKNRGEMGLTPTPGGGRRILIIDDDPVVRLLYMNHFKEAGFEVESAPDGEAAWSKLQKHCPDAVLLDLILPKGSGVDVLRRIRSQEGKLRLIPVFVFTNAYLSELSQEATHHGANRVFDKAVTPPRDIVAAVWHHLGLPDQPAELPPHGMQALGQAAVPFAGPESSLNSDAAAVRYFVFQMPQKISAILKDAGQFLQSSAEPERLGHLAALYHEIHALMGSAASAGLNHIAKQCALLEALLKELHENPCHLNASTSRSVAQAVEVLSLVFEQPIVADQQCQTRPGQVLVVCGDPIGRAAMAGGLEQVHFIVSQASDLASAVQALEKTMVDLVVLDLNTPGATRASLGAALRAAPNHADTPVLFVTSLDEFNDPSPLSTGNPDDRIAKPFVFMELAVKAMIHSMEARLGLPAGTAGSTTPPAASAAPERQASVVPPAVVHDKPASPLTASEEAPTAPPTGPTESPITNRSVAPPPCGHFGIATLDDKCNIESINSGGAALFGYNPEELTGQTIQMIVPAGWPGSLLVSPTPDGRTDPGNGWVVGRHKNGAQFPVNVVLKPVAVGTYQRWTVIVRSFDQWQEVSERRAQYELERRLEKAEADLAASQAELGQILSAHMESEQRHAEQMRPTPAVEALTAEINRLKSGLETRLQESNSRLPAAPPSLSHELGRLCADLQRAAARCVETEAFLAKAFEEHREAARRTIDLAGLIQARLDDPRQATSAVLANLSPRSEPNRASLPGKVTTVRRTPHAKAPVADPVCA